jgi:hypothetical protein
MGQLFFETAIVPRHAVFLRIATSRKRLTAEDIWQPQRRHLSLTLAVIKYTCSHKLRAKAQLLQCARRHSALQLQRQ